MQLTREIVDRLHKLTAAVQQKENIASEILRTAQDQYGHREHEVEREDPKTGKLKRVKLTEKTLWNEVFYLGAKHEVGQFMEKLHPQVFEAYREQEKAAKELQTFVIAEMGVDMKKMRISDYVALTEAIVDLRLDERDQGKESDGSVKSPIQDI